MSVVFRRICTKCERTVEWSPDGGEEGTFFHLDDKTPLCEGAHAGLEIKQTEAV